VSLGASQMAAVMRCEISSGTEGLQQARCWVRELARQNGLDSAEQVRFCAAAVEALQHVIEQAYAGCEGFPILLNASNGGDQVALSIRDYGRKPWWPQQYECTPGPLPEGAYRLWRLYGLVDDVRIDSTPRQGSILTLVKKRGGLP
jgi:anti-sigma regulatory factor (Ser/Thr protein kinase)